jgi:hypothetical protein
VYVHPLAKWKSMLLHSHLDMLHQTWYERKVLRTVHRLKVMLKLYIPCNLRKIYAVYLTNQVHNINSILRTCLRHVSVQVYCTIFREKNISTLKPITNDKLLLTRFFRLEKLRCWCRSIKLQFVQVFKNLWVRCLVQIFWKTFSRGHSSKGCALITRCCLSHSLFICILKKILNLLSDIYVKIYYSNLHV